MKTLKEVSEMVGMSRRVIQEYEKAGVAHTPTTRNKYGYLLYDQAHIDKLWQIRFYRELGYKKMQILRILEDPDYDQRSALEDKILRFQKKKTDLENLITMAQTAEETGITPTNIRSSVPGLENASYNHLISLIGTGIQLMRENTDLFEDAISKLTEQDLDQAFFHIMEIMDLADADASVDSAQVQQQVHLLHQVIARKLSASVILLSWCNLLFAPGTRVAFHMDSLFWAGSADFLHRALRYYCGKHSDNSADRLLMGSLRQLEQYGREKLAPASLKVQQQVRNLHRFLQAISVLAPEYQLRLLKALGQFYENEVLRMSGRREDSALSPRFVADAIEIYCDHQCQDIKED